jgi:hypothetical protein
VILTKINTLKYMQKYGINNVRGDAFCKIQFKFYMINKGDSFLFNRKRYGDNALVVIVSINFDL